MKLTHFGHASVLVETENGRRALLDPGTYSSGFEALSDIDLLLLTHAHPDHVDAERFGAIRDANPGAVLVANDEAAALANDERSGDKRVSGDEAFEIAGIRVQPTGAVHAAIHPKLPPLANTGFVLDDSVWHPGDAFDATPRHVDVLLLPVGGPWMKVSEAIDFAAAVAPRVIIPIHQGGLADVHRQLHYRLISNLVSTSELRVLEEGVTHEI